MQYTPRLIGNEHIQTYLQKTVKNGTVAHAQLWLGPEHVGKSTFLINYLFSLSCLRRDKSTEPCLRCERCRALQKDTHPNIVWLDASDKAVKFDAIRQARSNSLHTTLHGGMRAIIIQQADALHATSSNALLKLLEEPTPGLFIFLLVNDKEYVPATVVSRCLCLNFSPVAKTELTKVLPKTSQRLMVIAQGLPGRVIHFTNTPSEAKLWLDTISTWLTIMQTSSFGTRLQLAQTWLNQERNGDNHFRRALYCLSLVLHDLLLVQTEVSIDQATQDYQVELQSLAEVRPVTSTITALQFIQMIWQRQRTIPIQKKLVLSNLLLVI